MAKKLAVSPGVLTRPCGTSGVSVRYCSLTFIFKTVFYSVIDGLLLVCHECVGWTLLLQAL